MVWRTRNRTVDFGDFQRLEQNFGKVAANRPTGSDGDFNHDGVVDRLDLQILTQQMNQTLLPAPAPVPAVVPSEPVPVSTTPPAKPTSPAPPSKPAPVTASKPVAAVPLRRRWPLPLKWLQP